MLQGNGFKTVYNMAGGIKAWESKTAMGSPDQGMALFSGRESPKDILKVAYSLEQGLREFYLSMEKESVHDEVKKLFLQLSDIEVKHQMAIYLAYCDLLTEEISKKSFEQMVTQKAMEGGMTTQEYLDLFQPDLDSPVDAVSLAMSIEAQALDLYHRLAGRIENETSRQIVQQIAHDEKRHLESLGRLMDSL